jgi:hypothetical protein
MAAGTMTSATAESRTGRDRFADIPIGERIARLFNAGAQAMSGIAHRRKFA